MNKITPALLLCFTLIPCAAHACIVCQTPTAVEVRTRLADDVNLTTLTAVAGPFAVVAGAVALLHFDFRSKS